MTAHPIDTDRLLARIARLEAQSAIRGRAVVIYQARAREAEAERDWNLRSSRLAKEERIKANARAERAEARVRHLEDTTRVLVKDMLAATDARDEHRRGKAAAEAQVSEEKRLRMKATAAVTEAEAERDAARRQYDEDTAYWIAATDTAEARIKAVERLAYAADDGTEYEHNGHDPTEGEAECPGCWALGIRRALDGDA